MVEEVKLIQFQCLKEGTLFYYQHTLSWARNNINCCPSCGSKRVKITGRIYPALDERQEVTQ